MKKQKYLYAIDQDGIYSWIKKITSDDLDINTYDCYEKFSEAKKVLLEMAMDRAKCWTGLAKQVRQLKKEDL